MFMKVISVRIIHHATILHRYNKNSVAGTYLRTPKYKLLNL